MLPSPSLIVFDFDGTLAETRSAVVAVVHGALRAHDLPRVAPLAIHLLMGLPLETLFRRCVPPTVHAPPIDGLVRSYREHFDTVGGPLVSPCPGADEALRALANGGVPMALATSREASSLLPLLDRFGWRDHFAVLGTCDRVTHGKPHPELLNLVLAEAGVGPEAACMVGDTTFDVEMALAAGVRAVAVPDGCHPRARLEEAGAHVVLDHLRDLPSLVAGLGAGHPPRC